MNRKQKRFWTITFFVIVIISWLGGIIFSYALPNNFLQTHFLPGLILTFLCYLLLIVSAVVGFKFIFYHW